MGSTPDKDRPEERLARRERTLLPARISFGDGGALSTECVVTQLSEIGARVNVPASLAMPDRFDLSIPQRGLTLRARLIWRKDDQAGIAFDKPEPAPPAPPEDLQAKVRELEAANAKLRARVAELVEQVRRLTEL